MVFKLFGSVLKVGKKVKNIFIYKVDLHIAYKQIVYKYLLYNTYSNNLNNVFFLVFNNWNWSITMFKIWCTNITTFYIKKKNYNKQILILNV